jgi:hypothetical protein
MPMSHKQLSRVVLKFDVHMYVIIWFELILNVLL